MAYGCCAGMGDSGRAPLDGLGQYDQTMDQGPTYNPGVSTVPPGEPWYAPIFDGPSYNPGMSDNVPVGDPWYKDIITGAIQAGTQIAQQVLGPARQPQYTPGYGYPSTGGPGGPYPPGVPTTAPIYQQGTYARPPFAATSMASSYLPWVLSGGVLLLLLLKRKR